MTDTMKMQIQTKELIDRLKNTTNANGLGNSGNEYVVIVQMFLYKFLNDKFIYTAQNEMPELASEGDVYAALDKLSDDEYDELCDLIADTVILKRDQLLPNLAKHQNDDDFARRMDAAFEAIAAENEDVFFIINEDSSKIHIIKPISDLIIGSAAIKNAFCKALINDISTFSFASVFNAGYDFFATIFEYLLKDYNANGGGVYAEYYTPHSVASIIAKLLVPEGSDLKSQTCCDPAAGTGTLLLALAHAIGEDRCTIYTQDLSDKSSTMLMLNLILNNMTHSLNHVIKGNTLTHPYHKDANGHLKQFDFVVTNPPFKLDFSDYREQLASADPYKRFFAGVPNIPSKNKKGMAIYLCFFQHVLATIKEGGKGAVVVPTGFLTARSIEQKIRKYLVDNKYLKGVISMPSNIFATTGTSVSVIFIDKGGVDKPILIDASKLGTEIKDGKNKKTTVLTDTDINLIVDTFHNFKEVDKFSVTPTFDEINDKSYSFSAGQYFDIELEYSQISHEEFIDIVNAFMLKAKEYSLEQQKLNNELVEALKKLEHE